MDNLIILGENGMLGTYIKKYFRLRDTMKIICINRQIFDAYIDSIEKLEDILKPHLHNKTVVFNAIGAIPQVTSNSIDQYNKINTEFPHKLSTLCNLYGAKMIHPSTDCVYSGKRGNYIETDLHDEINAYGTSKSHGEPINCTVIRTSIIGEEVSSKKSLVEWVKSNISGEINGYANHYWNGITCLQYAKIVELIIQNNIFWQGVRHIYSPTVVSKYELVHMVNDIYKLNIKINKFEKGELIDKSLNSVYEENKLFKIPELKNQIMEMQNFSEKIYDKTKNIGNHFNRLKLITIIGTRPEIIRLACIIREADKYFDHILVHTGQNWDKQLSDVFFDELNIRKPDYFLNVVGLNLGETMGNVISKSYNLFKELNPDCLLILGDTNSSLCAISAKRLKIPIFHMEAGNRCYDLNVPEEINRKIVDHISDINLPYTENSRRYLINEGVRGDYIFVTGTPLKEVLDYYHTYILKSNILDKLKLNKNGYILLSCHREENLDIEKNFIELIHTLNTICLQYPIPIIFSTHPRTKNKLELNNIVLHPLIQSVEPFGFIDYCNLQLNALCVLSDSGSVSEEASILNFPAVSFRTSTERPEALDKGNIIIGNIKSDYVLNSINMAINMYQSNKNIKSVDYCDTNVSEKVIKIIQSYTPIVNKVIWHK